MNRYDFVRYRPEHRSGVVSLYRHVLGPHEDLNEGYLRWKHEEHPEASIPVLFLALHDGEVVGMRGFMPQTWVVGSPSHAVPMWHAGDLVVHPEHRSRGLVPHIMRMAHRELADEGRRWIINASGVRFTHQSSLRLGWKSAGARGVVRREGAAPLAVRVAGRVARRLNVPPPSVGPPPLTEFDRDISRLRSLGVSVALRPRPAAMAALVERLPAEAPLRLLRDEGFFRWRFRNPRSVYRYLYLEDGAGLHAYAVVHTHARTPESAVSLVAWEAADLDGARLLLEAVSSTTGRALESWSQGRSPEHQALFAAHGLLPHVHEEVGGRDRPDHLIVRALKAAGAGAWEVEGHSLLDPATWELRPLCSDAF